MAAPLERDICHRERDVLRTEAMDLRERISSSQREKSDGGNE